MTRLVTVYAFEKKAPDGSHRLLTLSNGRPMITPFFRMQFSIQGTWMDEGKYWREARRVWHKVSRAFALKSTPNLYSANEHKGRTNEQRDASEAFEKTHCCPPEMPITTTNNTINERVIVVEVDLDNLSDVRPWVLPVNQRFQQKPWVLTALAEWRRANPTVGIEGSDSKIRSETQLNHQISLDVAAGSLSLGDSKGSSEDYQLSTGDSKQGSELASLERNLLEQKLIDEAIRISRDEASTVVYLPSQSSSETLQTDAVEGKRSSTLNLTDSNALARSSSGSNRNN